MTFNIVCPGKVEYSGINRWVEHRPRYKAEIEMLDELGVTFEYFAEDVVAHGILEEFQVKSKRCVTCLPQLDEIYYFKKLTESKALPEDFRSRYEERVTLNNVNFKYPKPTKFTTLSEYMAKREAAFYDNMRKSMYEYLKTRSYILQFIGKNSIVRAIEHSQSDGLTYLAYDFNEHVRYTYYGGEWVDHSMLKEIIKMEIETENEDGE